MNWLATLPSTNALVATGILMALVTTVAVIVGWKPPDGWFLFVCSFAGVGSAHFTAKRWTQSRFRKEPPAARPDADGTAG